jgi:hypothetical protein
LAVTVELDLAVIGMVVVARVAIIEVVHEDVARAETDKDTQSGRAW